MQLWDLQETASKTIFATRNTKESILNGKIDLHGLTVSEADICLCKLLPILASEGQKRVTVITGTGHHSVDGRSRLIPVVEKFCIKNSISMKEVKTGMYVGGFELNINLLAL
jgi:DNA-nicking Smr family endonuclease